MRLAVGTARTMDIVAASENPLRIARRCAAALGATV